MKSLLNLFLFLIQYLPHTTNYKIQILRIGVAPSTAPRVLS